MTDAAAPSPADQPIFGVVARWHEFMRGRLPGGLDELLHPDVVFWSPIVFRPQEGREITKLYLQAAAQALPGDAGGPSDEGDAESDAGPDADPADRTPKPGRFRYVKQVLQGDTAVLEFETTVDGRYVNGVDIIRCDAEGRIVEFRVMIRPLQAVNAVHEQMGRMLASMQGG